MTKTKAVITGIGGYVPEYVLNNQELSKMVETTDEWIMTRVGIKERRILKEPHAGTSFLAAKAVLELFAKQKTDPDDIDAIICATSTPDYIFPATAAIVAEKVGVKNAFAFDIQAACSGFITALTVGAGYIESGRYKKVLVIGAEKMSSIVDYTDRQTCPLFGDGAGVVLLEPTTEALGIQDFIIQTNGEGVKHLQMKAGGSANPASIETIKKREHFIYQEGAVVFKNAVSDMSDVCVSLMERNTLTHENLAWLIPHQANLRIIDAIVKRTQLDYDKVIINIQKYGNTSAASIPLGLWDNESKFKKGDNIILTAFGAGFTWGAVYLKWGY